MADPWLKIIKVPNKARIIIIGNNQYFFLVLINSTNSLINEIIKLYKKSNYTNLLDCPVLIVKLIFNNIIKKVFNIPKFNLNLSNIYKDIKKINF